MSKQPNTSKQKEMSSQTKEAALVAIRKQLPSIQDTKSTKEVKHGTTN